MEEAQRLEIAARVRELRERSPYSQQNMADKLGLTLRAYQKLEKQGTTRWERAEELAEIHSVTPEWVWSGQDKLPAPDVVGSFEPPWVGEIKSQLAEVQAELADVREIVGQIAIARALAVDVPTQAEGQPEAEAGSGTKPTP